MTTTNESPLPFLGGDGITEEELMYHTRSCSCIPVRDYDVLASAANRLCGAVVNGETPDDADLAAVREWAADMLWQRSNGGSPGPHHTSGCPLHQPSYTLTVTYPEIAASHAIPKITLTPRGA